MSPLTGNQSTDINMLIGKVPYLKLSLRLISYIISVNQLLETILNMTFKSSQIYYTNNI